MYTKKPQQLTNKAHQSGINFILPVQKGQTLFYLTQFPRHKMTKTLLSVYNCGFGKTDKQDPVLVLWAVKSIHISSNLYLL